MDIMKGLRAKQETRRVLKRQLLIERWLSRGQFMLFCVGLLCTTTGYIFRGNTPVLIFMGLAVVLVVVLMLYCWSRFLQASATARLLEGRLASVNKAIKQESEGHA